MSEVAWPIWTLEFTPSGASADSYPLEVGVASWTGPDTTITTWSTPINPFDVDDWREVPGPHAGIVGLDEHRLRSGMSPYEVATTLNDIFMTSTVHGRGGTTDVHAAGRLNLAAKTWPTYNLSSWRQVCERHPERAMEAWDLIRATDGDAAERACATMRAIALLLGRRPEGRRVPTMAISLPI